MPPPAGALREKTWLQQHKWTNYHPGENNDIYKLKVGLHLTGVGLLTFPNRENTRTLKLTKEKHIVLCHCISSSVTVCVLYPINLEIQKKNNFTNNNHSVIVHWFLRVGTKHFLKNFFWKFTLYWLELYIHVDKDMCYLIM